jgi:NAD(P)-dependent dehydrogenase (short-subunit alcohol dehydrogenase family)
LNKFSLHNRTILITGASSGIGRSCAIEASSLGALCIIVGRNSEKLNETAKLCHTKTEIIVCDITDQEGLKQLVAKVDQLDGVVHCAGITHPRPIKFLKPEHIHKIFDINFTAPVLLTSMLLQKNAINEGASFVFISSVSSSHPYFGGSMYVSSKAALEAFSKSLAVELAPKKIRSNAIKPGLVDTIMLTETKEAGTEENFKEYEKLYPLGFGTTLDVANAVCYLLSNEAKWMTGSELKMDGGLVLNSKKN